MTVEIGDLGVGRTRGFSSDQATWEGIVDALTYGNGRTWLQNTFRPGYFDAPGWFPAVQRYMESGRTSADQALVFPALDDAIRTGFLTFGGDRDVGAFLFRLKCDELVSAYKYYRSGGINIQGLAEQLPGNLRIGLASSGAGALLIDPDVLGRVKALSAEATLAEGESSSLTEGEKTPAPGTAAAVWADYGTWIVAGVAALVIAVIYYKWVK